MVALIGVTFASAWAKVPDDPKTAVTSPADWRESRPTADNPSDLAVNSSFPDPKWWTGFQDANLTAYIQVAVENNPQLAIAEAHITEERALARNVLAQEFPQLSASPSYFRERNSTALTQGGAVSPATTSAASSTTSSNALGVFFPATVNYYSVPLVVNYEADIWLKNRDKYKSAKLQALAAARNYQSTRISLITEVSSAYFNLLAVDQLIALQNQYIQLEETDVAQTARKYDAGLETQEDVVIKQQILSDSRATLQADYRQRALDIDELALLMGKTAEEIKQLSRKSLDDVAVPTIVPAGVPSELMARRPDILAAEDTLRASKIDVRVARKAFLPSINLTGEFGFASLMTSNLFNWSNRVLALGGSLSQPIFEGGSLRANLNVTKARYREQLYNYHQTILQSFREVDDSLAQLRTDRNAYENYEASVASFQKEYQFEQNRLQAGAIASADVIPVQLQLTLSQEGLVRSKLSALADVLSLYKALGGGY